VVAATQRRQAVPPRRPVAQLTEREAAVYSLLGRGATNAEIAAALSLSVRTVEGHVAHLLDKRGFASRAVAIAHAALELRALG